MPTTPDSCSHSCPRCGAGDTAARGTRRFCPRCEDSFVPRRCSLPHVIYTASYDPTLTCQVTVVYPLAAPGSKRSELLDPRLDIWNHSPTGMGYGYAGSGPAQLALAILLHFLGPGREGLASTLHQAFKFDRISSVPNSQPLVIPGEDVAAWLRESDAGKRALGTWYAEFPHEVLSLDV